MKSPLSRGIYWLIVEPLLAPILLIMAMASRFISRKIDVGIGPEAIISHGYHKQSLNLHGYSAETFVHKVFYITNDFDIRSDLSPLSKIGPIRPIFFTLHTFFISVFRYRCLYFYFNGGALSLSHWFLWRIEPLLYKIAGVKVVVMPYGSDVQDMSRSPNLIFRHVMSQDYPAQRWRRRAVAHRIDLWTRYADHVISGVEWVDYMYYWDTLTLAHFSIDTERWKPTLNTQETNSGLRILHAPNHRAIKGTRFFVNAVNELKEEGFDIELVLLERVPNDEVKRMMETVDVVADQLIIGWYAMFAMEAMALEKPVLCYLREDLVSLYMAADLIEPNEIPIIQATPATVKERIRELAVDKAQLQKIGHRSREYVIKHHSINAIGRMFERINTSMGMKPSLTQGDSPT